MNALQATVDRLESVGCGDKLFSWFSARSAALALEAIDLNPVGGAHDADAALLEEAVDAVLDRIGRWGDGEIGSHFCDSFVGTREIGADDSCWSAFEPAGDVETRNGIGGIRRDGDGAVRVWHNAILFVEWQSQLSQGFVFDGHLNRFCTISH